MKIGNRIIIISVVIITFFVSSIAYYEWSRGVFYTSFCTVSVDFVTCQDQNVQIKISTYAHPHTDPLENLFVLIDDTKISGTWKRINLEKVNPGSWLYDYTFYPNVSLKRGAHSLKVIGSCNHDKAIFQC